MIETDKYATIPAAVAGVTFRPLSVAEVSASPVLTLSLATSLRLEGCGGGKVRLVARVVGCPYGLEGGVQLA